MRFAGVDALESVDNREVLGVIDDEVAVVVGREPPGGRPDPFPLLTACFCPRMERRTACSRVRSFSSEICLAKNAVIGCSGSITSIMSSRRCSLVFVSTSAFENGPPDSWLSNSVVRATRDAVGSIRFLGTGDQQEYCAFDAMVFYRSNA